MEVDGKIGCSADMGGWNGKRDIPRAMSVIHGHRGSIPPLGRSVNVMMAFVNGRGEWCEDYCPGQNPVDTVHTRYEISG